MRKFIEKCCDGVVKEWGMIVALVLLAMPPMLFHPVFFGGLHSGLVNGFDAELWRQLKYPIVDMGLLMLLVIVTVEIVHWIGKWWFKWVVYGVGIALASARIWLWWVFRLRITPMALTLLMETNSQESSEFVREYLMGWFGIGFVGIVVGLVGLCWAFELLSKKFLLRGVWKKIVLYIGAVCLVWGLVEVRWNVRLLCCKTSEEVGQWQEKVLYDDICIIASNPQALLFSTVCVRCVNNDVSRCGLTAYEVQKKVDEVFCQNDSLIVVFVLGESYSKAHCGLYGYERETTLCMKQEQDRGNLYVFSDAVSPCTYTSRFIKSAFFVGDTSQQWYKSAFFPQIFKMAGYDVDLWSNQQKLPNTSRFISNDIVSVLYNKHIREMSYSNVSDIESGYDEKMVDDYLEKSFDLNCNRFVIFHLMGQHVSASERFPHTKENLIFSGIYEKSERIAMYDNACVYNDKVISKIIDLVRDKKSVVVYFSDHGEEVYDYRDCYGRKAAEPGKEKEFLKYQAEVPFMIWCSDKYKEAYPETIGDIEKSVDKPFITDNVCQVMFHLAGLKSLWYKEERDLLSEKYKCRKRIVNGEYDYDDVMSRK